MSDNPIAEQQLAMKAAAIRAIGKRAVCDLIEIGRLLTDAKLLAGSSLEDFKPAGEPLPE